jgi:hypothetical protein
MDKLKQLRQWFQHQLAKHQQHKEQIVENNQMYTEDQLMARLKFFIGICLALTLTGIVFVVLYSIIFVTQPLNAISPIDQKFFELIIPIATFLTGTLSGIMLAGNDKDAQKAALQAANKGWDKPPTPIQIQKNETTSAPTFSTAPSVSPTVTNSFGTQSMGSGNSFGSVSQPQVITGFGGKPAPAPAPQPEL